MVSTLDSRVDFISKVDGLDEKRRQGVELDAKGL